MSTLQLSAEQAEKRDQRSTHIRQAWVQDVTALADQVSAWASGQGWPVTPAALEVREDTTIGAYIVPKLEIQTPEGQIVLEPVARGVLGADGRVDLYAWPSYFRVMLLRRTHRNAPATWTIRTESGLDWPKPWDEQTFIGIAGGLARAS